jgi:hypothetical protein
MAGLSIHHRPAVCLIESSLCVLCVQATETELHTGTEKRQSCETVVSQAA